MKNVPAVATAVRTRHNLTAVPEATIEWNMNRYFDLTVSNSVDETLHGNDPDMYPLDSIVQPWRPTKGINKARVGYGYVTSNYNDWPTARFYVGSEKDKYKYWMSPTPSDGNGGLPNCAPQVVYDETFYANKIKVVVENTWASPVDFAIQFSADGGNSWSNTVAAPVQNDGTIEVFWTGTAWTAQRPTTLAASLPMNGIRFVCTRLGTGKLLDGSNTRTRVYGSMVNTTGASSYLSLIELAPYLVRDVSSEIVSMEDNFEAGEPDVVSPVGTITSNVGSITLWGRDENNENLFSRDNTSSPYHKLIEQNAEITGSLVYNIDGTSHKVRQFRLYADEWVDNDDGTVSVEMSDASKHLMTIKPNAAKYEGMKFSEIMYRLCDSVGWNFYNVDTTPRAKDITVPIYWTDGDKTLWELLDDLATVSQSVIYFDEYGMMNVKTREDAFAPDAAPVWTLRGRTAGNELADIINVDAGTEFGSNMVKIVYRKTAWADINNGFAENTVVWEADDPTVLRSSPLLRTLEVGDERFVMPGGEAATWPHTGQALIEGEVIEYDAKMFVYQDQGRMNWAWVTSQSEHDDYNNRIISSLRHWNHYDGQFRIKERGQWNTAVKRHPVDIDGWNATRFMWGGVVSGGGFHHDKRYSMVSLRTTGLINRHDEYLNVTRGVPGDSPWRYIGTRMAFSSGNAQHQAGGIVFNAGGGKDGYYVELCPTSQISEKDREVRNELVFYIIKNNQRSPNWPNKGARAPVALDSWGELDIWYSVWDQRIKIFYRGKEYFHFNIPGGWELNPGGKFGMYARGSTDVSFDYVYASSRHADPEPTAEYSAIHAIEGISIGREYTEEWKHRNTRRQRNRRKKTGKSIFDKNQRFMDEFGPYVHEFKEFEVKFDPAPVQNSFPYSTNNQSAYLIDYRGDSFGANFTMVSTERYNSVLSGEDSMAVPGGEPINQQLVVFGRALVIEEGEEIVAKNEQQIRARGEIVTEINSDWIQSKEAAQEIADWIVKHWSEGVDEINVSVFGNPLFRIGDVVAVDHPEKDMAASTHHYFVTAVSNSFDGGVSTNLTLRRRN